MSLRSRYSLLTLLVLTALVAGGVKLWYGPHRVIEHPRPNFEDEFTYTRDWRGVKIVHGPRIFRYSHPDGTLHHVLVLYYLHGKKTYHAQELTVLTPGGTLSTTIVTYRPAPLPPADDASFRAAIEREIAKIKEQGREPYLRRYEYYEGIEYQPFDETP